ncbi:excinuclease ABC subunit UvrB [Candidatus Uhrbacteria bacterium]|nr:excinuclease ABC subunit UvrB [Candidatus Uhrbacteria bacterium]
MQGEFELKSDYRPSGDQPQAIESLVDGISKKLRYQTLLGATGTGKTFTIANVIQQVQKPTLVIAHNKTLAAQLCNEFRDFFPDNAVEYFVSYYDYYQPEAYIAKSDTYIEKEAMINQEIDRLRHNATQALLTRRDVIICASVSCIYGLGAPVEYLKSALQIAIGDDMKRSDVLSRLVEMQFTRLTNTDLVRGSFRTTGAVLEVMPANEEKIYRIEAPRGFVDAILVMDPVTKRIIREQKDMWLFPAKHFITDAENRERALKAIREELKDRVSFFEKQGKLLEADRLDRRTKYDLEMMENLGYCNGIENYSRHMSGRHAGEAPDSLFSYFPEDFLLVVDESHVTIPQLGGMYEGDRSRKQNLIDHGFRLPSAADNRPMKFSELEEKFKQLIMVSATPSQYEMSHSQKIVEQIIRPTGLIDPEVIIRPITPTIPTKCVRKNEHDRITDLGLSQVDDAILRIEEVTKRGDRVLVTTLTKKMAEDLSNFLKEKGMKSRYLHSDIDTIERLEILSDFRRGNYDVVVGVNLLREGLDLPEVALVCILDADKEGFLRSETSLIQTIGRAARNVRGQVVLYADNMTESMRKAIAETERRRTKQIAYNKEHGITPKTIIKEVKDIRKELGLEGGSSDEKNIKEILKLELTAETHDLKQVVKQKTTEMKQAAQDLQFELAAILRDEIGILNKELKNRDKEIKKSESSPKKPRGTRHGRTR